MVLVLPPFLTLAGIVLLGALIGLIVYGAMGLIGFCLADAHEFGEWLIALAIPAGLFATAGAWLWLWGLA